MPPLGPDAYHARKIYSTIAKLEDHSGVADTGCVRMQSDSLPNRERLFARPDNAGVCPTPESHLIMRIVVSKPA